MDQSAGQHVQGAIFASEGVARHRAVRIAVAGGIALLVAWLIALVVGVIGGFGSLPLLPSTSDPSKTAGSAERVRQAGPAAQTPVRATVAKTQAPAASHAPVHRTGGRSKASPKVTTRPTQQPSTVSTVRTQGHGKGLTQSTTQSSGKPVDSPGNGPGGSGAPGQLR